MFLWILQCLFNKIENWNLTKKQKSQNINFNFKSIINSNISNLWNLFKLTCRKVDHNLVFIFNNIEHLESETFKKFLQYGKDTSVSFLATVNQALKPSTLDLLSEFDLKKKLNYFSYKERFYILKQRVSLTCLREVDKELVEFITDLIFEHYVPVPGKGIEILREIYPVLNQQVSLNNLEISEILRNQFDSLQATDEFSMLSYISEAELLTIIFLDNLSNHF